jgi:hypothetical protein
MNHVCKNTSSALALACSLALVGCADRGPLDEDVAQSREALISYTAPAAGDPGGYVRSDGYNSVPHIDVPTAASSDVMELFLGGSTWAPGDWGNLSAISGAPAGVGNVASYVRSDGFNAVVYWSTDNHLHEIRLAKDEVGSWRPGDLTIDSGSVACVNHSSPTAYVRSDGADAIVYCCADSDNAGLWEIYLPDGGPRWLNENLTGKSGAPACNGDVVAYERSDGYDAVLFVDQSTIHIWEISSDEPTVGWGSADLFIHSGATEPVESLWSSVQAHVRSDGTNSVVYTGADRHIHEIYLTPHASWLTQDLMVASGDTASSILGRPFGWNRSDGVTSYVFFDTMDFLQEITLTGTSWGHDYLGGSSNIAGITATAYVRADSANAVVYYGAEGHIFEASLVPGATAWGTTDLTAVTGEPVE